VGAPHRRLSADGAAVDLPLRSLTSSGSMKTPVVPKEDI
jgi:hypothetical protein